MKIRQARKIMRNEDRAHQPWFKYGSRPWRRPIYRGNIVAKAKSVIDRHPYHGLHLIRQMLRAWTIPKWRYISAKDSTKEKKA